MLLWLLLVVGVGHLLEREKKKEKERYLQSAVYCSVQGSQCVRMLCDKLVSHNGLIMDETRGDDFDPVLLNTFIIKKQRCRVYFHRGVLIWESEGAPYSKYMTTDLEFSFGMSGSVHILRCFEPSPKWV